MMFNIRGDQCLLILSKVGLTVLEGWFIQGAVLHDVFILGPGPVTQQL